MHLVFKSSRNSMGSLAILLLWTFGTCPGPFANHIRLITSKTLEKRRPSELRDWTVEWLDTTSKNALEQVRSDLEARCQGLGSDSFLFVIESSRPRTSKRFRMAHTKTTRVTRQLQTPRSVRQSDALKSGDLQHPLTSWAYV
jgi:hypothetical protein